ncbi:hypothetical protein AKJ16_DCAP24254 [Drosera capensis]
MASSTTCAVDRSTSSSSYKSSTHERDGNRNHSAHGHLPSSIPRKGQPPLSSSFDTSHFPRPNPFAVDDRQQLGLRVSSSKR